MAAVSESDSTFCLEKKSFIFEKFIVKSDSPDLFVVVFNIELLYNLDRYSWIISIKLIWRINIMGLFISKKIFYGALNVVKLILGMMALIHV